MLKKIVAVAVLVLGVFLIWYAVPKGHSVTVQGVAYQLNNEEKLDFVEIHIDGKLRHHVFSQKRTFTGTIDIEGEEMPGAPGERVLELVFDGDNRGFINYGYVGENGSPRVYSYGVIYVNRDFSEFTIAKFHKEDAGEWAGSWSGEDGLMITAPAGTREEGLAISNELMKGFLLEGYSLK